MKVLAYTKKLFTLSLVAISLFLLSCNGTGINPTIPGLTGPKLYLDEEFVRIDAIFEKLEIVGGGRLSFDVLGLTKYPNSFLEFGPDVLTGGTLIAIHLSLQDVLYGEGVDQLDPQSLPDGRPLPGIQGGRLPAIAFDVDSINNMGFYIGTRVFGIWYPLPALQIGQNNIITARFYSDGVRAGNLSMVGPNEEGTGSGVLLLADLGDKTKGYLKEYYKNWKKKNNR
jgi:hypothetical protein